MMYVSVYSEETMLVRICLILSIAAIMTGVQSNLDHDVSTR